MTRHTPPRWLGQTITTVLLPVVLMLPRVPAFGEDPIPITGDPAPGLEGFDDAMKAVMQRYGIPGGALAVVREEQGGMMRVVLEHGYGYWDRDRSLQAQPGTRFRIASISKPITAAAILKLIQESRGKITLDTKVSDILSEFKNPTSGDPRISTITIRNLIEHKGGWDDSQIGFDPMYWAVHQAKVPRPGTSQEIIDFMLTRRLDFNPGTQEKYSNFGYCVLGRVIEKLSDESYGRYVEENIAKPLKMDDTLMGGTLAGDRLPFESRYYDYPAAPLIDSVFDGSPVPWPYGGFNMQAQDAGGGWVSTTTDLLRFLVSMNNGQHAVIARPYPGLPQFEGEVPPFNQEGQSWDWFKTGSHPGTMAGLRLLAIQGQPRTYWCFLTNTRPTNSEAAFTDFANALNNAVTQAEQGGKFGNNKGHPLWSSR